MLDTAGTGEGGEDDFRPVPYLFAWRHLGADGSCSTYPQVLFRPHALLVRGQALITSFKVGSEESLTADLPAEVTRMFAPSEDFTRLILSIVVEDRDGWSKAPNYFCGRLARWPVLSELCRPDFPVLRPGESMTVEWHGCPEWVAIVGAAQWNER